MFSKRNLISGRQSTASSPEMRVRFKFLKTNIIGRETGLVGVQTGRAEDKVGSQCHIFAVYNVLLCTNIQVGSFYNGNLSLNNLVIGSYILTSS